MDFLIDKILLTVPVAIIVIILGVTKLKKSIKELQEMDDDWMSPGIIIQGFAGAVGFIALGIIIIYFKLKGEW